MGPIIWIKLLKQGEKTNALVPKKQKINFVGPKSGKDWWDIKYGHVFTSSAKYDLIGGWVEDITFVNADHIICPPEIHR